MKRLWAASVLATSVCLVGTGQAEEQLHVNGKYVGETKFGLVPLRATVEALGAKILVDSKRHIILVAKSGEEFVQPKGRISFTFKQGKRTVTLGPTAADPYIYAGGERVLGGRIFSGSSTQAFGESLAKAMGVRFEYSKTAGKMSLTSEGHDPLVLVPGVYLEDSDLRWWPVDESRYSMEFKGAAIVKGRFSTELKIDARLFERTDKLITLNLLVTLYGPDGKIAAREQATVFGASSDGGTYLLEGPHSTEEVASCIIKFQGATVPRK